jgi:hypothetical protein
MSMFLLISSLHVVALVLKGEYMRVKVYLFLIG